MPSCLKITTAQRSRGGSHQKKLDFTMQYFCTRLHASTTPGRTSSPPHPCSPSCGTSSGPVRGVYFSKNQYLFTNPKNGPARESRDTLSLDSNISARTQKKAIFLHMVVIFLHGPKKKCVFYAQLNKKVAKSTLYHIIHCFACFSMI